MNSAIVKIKIPSSVTKICENAFFNCQRLQQIEIPNDSKLQTIEKDAFNNSKIEKITIPSELIDLKEGWCSGTLNIKKIEVSSNNPRYCLYEDKFILGKTKVEEDYSIYDCLIFCIRNIKHLKLPNFIKHICSYSFNYSNLETIEFSNESNLQTIDYYSFSWSKIKKIKIPSSVTLIGEHAFNYCTQLKYIEIPNDSKLETIDSKAFCNSTIKSITIPSSVKIIGEDIFYNCEQLQIIEINSEKVISMCKNNLKDCQNTIVMIPFNSIYANMIRTQEKYSRTVNPFQSNNKRTNIMLISFLRPQ